MIQRVDLIHCGLVRHQGVTGDVRDGCLTASIDSNGPLELCQISARDRDVVDAVADFGNAGRDCRGTARHREISHGHVGHGLIEGDAEDKRFRVG